MKKFILSMLCAIPLIFTVGCSSLNQSQVAKYQGLMHATVPPAVAIAVIQEPASAGYLRAAADTISIAAGNTNITPATLAEDLAKLNVKELKSPWAPAAVMAGVGIYQAFFADAVITDSNTVVLLETFASDIRVGLSEKQKAKVKRK